MALRMLDITRLIVVARLLKVNDFGIMGIALLTMAAMEMFSQTGISSALIQKKKCSESYLNTAWTISIIRGTTLCLILLLMAPYITFFFHIPGAKGIIQVLSLSFLLKGMSNIGLVYFRKNLQFHKQFVYELGGVLVDLIVTVYFAITIRNVWALALGKIAGEIARLLLSYTVHPYKPRLSFDLKKAKELFSFGKWLFISGIVLFFLNQGDDILVGNLLGATVLGIYLMAFKISNIPTTEITHTISQVTYPAYSKLQDDTKRLKDAYLRVLQLTGFLAFLVTTLTIALASDFTKIFLGEKWMSAVVPMQILAVRGLLRSLEATRGPMFLALGKPKVSTIMQLGNFAVFVILIYPFTIRWGIIGASCAVLLTGLPTQPYGWYILIKSINCSTVDFIKAIVPPLTGLIVTLLMITSFKSAFIEDVTIQSFAVITILGFSVYAAVAIVMDQVFGFGIKRIIGQLPMLKR